MSEKNKLGQASAFAFKEVKESVGGIPVNWTNHMGMSKRFYAACTAMQGLCVGKITSEIKKGECVDIAEMAYLIADELLKQENQ